MVITIGFTNWVTKIYFNFEADYFITIITSFKTISVRSIIIIIIIRLIVIIIPNHHLLKFSHHCSLTTLPLIDSLNFILYFSLNFSLLLQFSFITIIIILLLIATSPIVPFRVYIFFLYSFYYLLFFNKYFLFNYYIIK